MTTAEIETEKELDAGEVLEQLSRIDILRALPPEEVQALAPRVERIQYPPGTRFITQGEAGDALFFLEEGTARVERDGKLAASVGPGTVVGEAALLTGDPRTANVIAESDLTAWRVGKQAFDELVAGSPNLRQALQQLVEQRRQGVKPVLPSRQFWLATALRAVEARSRGMTGWELFMAVGMAIWSALQVNHIFPLVDTEAHETLVAILQLASGLFVIQGSCEGFLIGVERLGARRKWDGFISGTVGSLLSTLPEFVVIAFLVIVEPLAAFVTAIVTIFNNALAFSIYSFFLPKDRKGAFAMPRSVTAAGGEILIAGGAITLIVGIVMLVVRLEGAKATLEGVDLLGIGLVLLGIYAYYLLTLLQYSGEGKDDPESAPVDPHVLGHDTSWRGIGTMFALGIVGAYCGGESIGAFADTALKHIGLPTIPTAAALAFFAVVTLLLMLPLFPLFHTLHQYVEQEKALTNLDAAGMTGIYLLLLYFLFTSPV